MIYYVAGIVFDLRGSSMLLIRKTKPKWQAGRLNAIGGKVEPWETPDQAMDREFAEETGYKYPLSWLPSLNLQNQGQWNVAWYRAVMDISDLQHLHGRHSTNGEVTILVSYEDLSFGDIIPARRKEPGLHPAIRNLAWIIPLMLDPDIGGGLTIDDTSINGGDDGNWAQRRG